VSSAASIFTLKGLHKRCRRDAFFNPFRARDKNVALQSQGDVGTYPGLFYEALYGSIMRLAPAPPFFAGNPERPSRRRRRALEPHTTVFQTSEKPKSLGGRQGYAIWCDLGEIRIDQGKPIEKLCIEAYRRGQ